jgi:HD-like signal output (HDOD) protein/ActR/RegA family two-component response regulator
MSSERCRVLFVDDEPRILEGIARMLRPQRERIEVFTAPGGKEALQLLAANSLDVVISDMRMPHMDGAQLLGEIRNQHPRLIRIILSGQSDRDTIVRATSSAHQFLSKPCSSEDLRTTIDRCIRLTELLPNPDLRGRIAALNSLPSVPGVLEELRREMTSATSVDGASQRIAADPGLAAKIIQVTATSFFGISRGVLSPIEASRRLGTDVLKALDQAGHLPPAGDVAFPWLVWAAHARRTATLASAYAAQIDPDLAQAAEVAAMLHDCGRAALASAFGNDYIACAALDEGGLCEAEQQAFGCTHAQAGSFLLALWGLPEQVVDAVADHHHPARVPAQRLTAIIHAADALERDPHGGGLAPDAIGSAGIAPDLAAWQEAAARLPR